MSGRKKMVEFTVRISPDEHEALQMVASFKGKSMSDVNREALRAYLIAEAADGRIERWAKEAGRRFSATIKRLTEDT